MKPYPRVLHVDTSFAPKEHYQTSVWDATLDYHIYQKWLQPWRKMEQLLRMDLYLALKARRLSNQFDLILAGSERVGIPLSLMKLDCPIVTIIHHVASDKKRYLLNRTGAFKNWARIGYLSTADRVFLQNTFDLPSERFFPYISAPLATFKPTTPTLEGPIISVGTSKRDYQTLIKAVAELPNCRTMIYANSRYGDLYNGNQSQLPNWITFEPPVPYPTMPKLYAQAQFVVVPLFDSTQYSVGVSAVLEAAAAGKAVIATQTTGMTDYIIHNHTGLLVSPGDVKGLNNAINRLWQEPSLAHQMGTAARQFVEENFDPATSTHLTRKAITSAYLEYIS